MAKLKPNVSTGMWIILSLACILCKSTQANFPCGFPGKPANGKVVKESSYYTHGEVVQYECQTNYTLFHKNSVRRICNNGSWTSLLPVCSENIALGRKVQVFPIPAPMSESIVDNSKSSCLELKLASSKKRSGVQISLEEIRIVRQLNLHFTNGMPFNLKIYIEDSLTKRRKICGSNIGNYTGSVVRIHCNPGHAQGDTVVVEDHSDSSKPLVICDVQIYALPVNAACGLPEAPVFGWANFTSGKTIEYNCQPGYLLVGPQNRTCDPNGVSTYWPKGTVPLCIKDSRSVTKSSTFPSTVRFETTTLTSTSKLTDTSISETVTSTVITSSKATTSTSGSTSTSSSFPENTTVSNTSGMPTISAVNISNGIFANSPTTNKENAEIITAHSTTVKIPSSTYGKSIGSRDFSVATLQSSISEMLTGTSETTAESTDNSTSISASVNLSTITMDLSVNSTSSLESTVYLEMVSLSGNTNLFDFSITPEEVPIISTITQESTSNFEAINSSSSTSEYDDYFLDNTEVFSTSTSSPKSSSNFEMFATSESYTVFFNSTINGADLSSTFESTLRSTSNLETIALSPSTPEYIEIYKSTSNFSGTLTSSTDSTRNLSFANNSTEVFDAPANTADILSTPESTSNEVVSSSSTTQPIDSSRITEDFSSDFTTTPEWISYTDANNSSLSTSQFIGFFISTADTTSTSNSIDMSTTHNLNSLVTAKSSPLISTTFTSIHSPEDFSSNTVESISTFSNNGTSNNASTETDSVTANTKLIQNCNSTDGVEVNCTKDSSSSWKISINYWPIAVAGVAAAAFVCTTVSIFSTCKLKSDGRGKRRTGYRFKQNHNNATRIQNETYNNHFSFIYGTMLPANEYAPSPINSGKRKENVLSGSYEYVQHDVVSVPQSSPMFCTENEVN